MDDPAWLDDLRWKLRRIEPRVHGLPGLHSGERPLIHEDPHALTRRLAEDEGRLSRRHHLAGFHRPGDHDPRDGCHQHQVMPKRLQSGDASHGHFGIRRVP